MESRLRRSVLMGAALAKKRNPETVIWTYSVSLQRPDAGRLLCRLAQLVTQSPRWWSPFQPATSVSASARRSRHCDWKVPDGAWPDSG